MDRLVRILNNDLKCAEIKLFRWIENAQLLTFRYQMTVGAGHPTAFVPLLNKTGIT